MLRLTVILFLTAACLKASAQMHVISDSSLEITNPPNYPYGVNINVNYTQSWTREFGISYNGIGKLLSVGAFSNTGAALTYDYIGGNTTAGAAWQTPWMVFLPNGNIGIGTLTPQSLLAVNGIITAKQVTVTQTGWPDFVFDSGYQKASLTSVSSFIYHYRHLPGIPSATDLEKTGLDLGDMQKLQMQKIEELTLYAIDADRRITEQDTTIRLQWEMLLRLEQKVEQLEQKVNGNH